MLPNFSLVRNFSTQGKPNVLECRVCEDVFTLQGDKVPRLLYCGHTVCHSCLLRISPSVDVICCPFDRQPTPIGTSGIWGLKKNFALLELLERLQLCYEKEAATFLRCTEALEKEPSLYIRCDENDDHTAVFYCTVCATHLCETCSESTHSTRTLAKHRRVPLSEKPREKSRCPSHPCRIAEFTCLDEGCRSEPSLMCYLCKDYGRHKNHEHTLVETEADNIRTSVRKTALDMRNMMEEMGETLHRLGQVAVRIEGTTSTDGEILEEGTGNMVKARVRTYFSQLRETLMIQEVAAITAVDTHIRERLCSIRQLQEDLVAWLSQIAVACTQCDYIIQQDDARVLSARHEIREAVDAVEKHQQQFNELGQDRLYPDPNIPITFTKDNRVHIGPKMEMRVVTLGLDNAGKTSVLFKLKQNEFITQIPTIGFNVETVEYKNLKFTIWDVGGQPKLRPLWKHYYLNTQAIIFVVDSNDKSRLEESHEELMKLMNERELKDAALLILANKQDMEDCETVESITEKFSLYKLCCGRSWHIHGCDAPSGNGLSDGLDWLCRQLLATGVYDIS